MYPLISAFLLVSLSSAEPWHAAGSCALELNRMHTVRIKENVYLLYGDPGLASYLQTVLGTPLSVSIVPVFTGEPVAILHDNMAIVSTGLILRARDQEFSAALPEELCCAAQIGFGKMRMIETHDRHAERSAG